MVVSAVRATLAEEPYRSRFQFSLHGFETPEGQMAQQIYPFGADRHGFVVVDRTGAILACRPSHFYGREEIQGDFDEILGLRR